MKKLLSLFVAITLAMSNLFACSQITTTKTSITKKEIPAASVAYYSVTANQARSEKNHFMELNVKIPSIICSEDISDNLFNTINEEIKNNINKLVDEAITNAENTYQTYIATVKANLEQERENKIIALKNKYKSILTNDEVKAMSNVINSDIENFSNDDIHISATPSFINVNGFTNSENLIIPELHNKNIIIIETTEKETDISQTTMVVEGKPGRQNKIAPPEGNTDNYPTTPKNKNIEKRETYETNNNDEILKTITDHNNDNINDKNVAKEDTTNTNSDDTAEMETTNTNNENVAKGETTNANEENIIETSEVSNKTIFSNNNVKETEEFSSNDDILESRNFKREHYDRKNFNDSNNNFERKSFHPIKNNKNTENTISNEIQNFDILNEDSDLQEITKENFYIELEKIKKLKVPNKFRLAKYYIPTLIYCGFDVKCLDEDYLSLFIELSETRITSSSKRFYYNIDLKNKKLISIKDILGEDFKNTSIQCISNSIKNWSDEKKEDLIENYKIDNFIDENVNFFINNNHIPVIVLEKNTILTSGAGYPEFQIIK